ncbi:hypothetical protein BC936DRAFT_145610 [Jimgerdemannia flammicorona]|uniref:CBS domain-containing protein n=1 Tax=Jimgerdemannia flammicorona TaxID=994334 RepID=A0A433DNF4_9FUNG|nr:hypothetical protein BC936DRAFT_145610 [Jimgerdemannia flammicorona]
MKSYWPSVSSLSTPCTTNRALWRDDKHNSYPLNIGYTIAKLAATKAHRVWCIDERSKAVGAVSLTDILRIVAKASGINVSNLFRRVETRLHGR